MIDGLSIDENSKKRIIDFINNNDLDFSIIDSKISRFQLVSHDNLIFQILKFENKFIIHINDIKKEINNYYYYDNLQQIMEQLHYYDNNLPKTWYSSIISVNDVHFVNENYYDEWVNDYLLNNKYQCHNDGKYNYIIYEENMNIEIISPYNTLHEVSPLNELTFNKLNSLYMEIYHIDLSAKNEKFLVKILMNNEVVLKEYVNYIIFKKKGLKIFLNELFNNKIKNIQIKKKR